MKLRTRLLQTCLIAASLLAVIFALFVFPKVPGHLVYFFHNGPAAALFTTGCYGAAAAFLVAAGTASRLLAAADRAQAFTPQVVGLLRQLKRAVAAMTLMLCGVLPQTVVIAVAGTDPASVIMFLLMIAIPLVVTVFLAILERLWAAALAYKEENDLTV
ncbi:DUF2975 domain-containing protein [Schleiferilactobacillus shenzhenensis]|uniref:YoaS n=1 Tax=Schleiferilactobacillus shenzhenensis LY-73 TaxID=1231336 RepID=U4TU12_9LACO|nr:DUF2975 domain-containing protein [Schleiferilactobacillus shenzhenensis]ERL64927.1 hypothetical protein L248_0531 [Schleiferilactobacillus shenzhenensis LY-73]